MNNRCVCSVRGLLLCLGCLAPLRLGSSLLAPLLLGRRLLAPLLRLGRSLVICRSLVRLGRVRLALLRRISGGFDAASSA